MAGSIFGSGFDSALGTAKKVGSSINNVSNTVNSVSSSVHRLSTAAKNAIPGSSNSQSAASVSNASPAPVAANGVGSGTAAGGVPSSATAGATLSAPIGTCIILNSTVTSTGQPRYLGRNVYETISNMMQGKETTAHAVVVDDKGLPSAAIYEQKGDSFYLKGTNTPVKINIGSSGQIEDAVLLNEKEYAACVKSMSTTDQKKRYFAELSELGNAEDANAHSWFSRNWDWLLTVIATVIAGVASFFVFRRSQKQEKAAKNTASELRTQVDTLNNQVAELTEKSNALASNSSLVPDQENVNDILLLSNTNSRA